MSRDLKALERWPWEQRLRMVSTTQGRLSLLLGLVCHRNLRVRVGEEREGIARGHHVRVYDSTIMVAWVWQSESEVDVAGSGEPRRRDEGQVG